MIWSCPAKSAITDGRILFSNSLSEAVSARASALRFALDIFLKLGLILKMTYDEFISSLSSSNPPEKITDVLKALWYDGKNEWENSHNVAQEINDKNGSWVHAYLHRKEGDISNARYWYSRAGKTEPQVPLKEEWESLVKHFIQQA